MATKKGKDGFYYDNFPPLKIVSATEQRWDFNAARNDAITLISIHDAKAGGKAGRPPLELDALKRSALILGVTAWESFVEDTVAAGLKARVDAAQEPADMQSTFNSVAREWMDPARSGRHQPPDLAKWTGVEWKKRIEESLAKELKTFHTPNTENTSELFETYLGIKIKDHWRWQNTTPAQAKAKLDKLIKERGKAVHRGKRMLGPKPDEKPIGRAQVVAALNLLFMLVDATEKALGCSPTVQP